MDLLGPLLQPTPIGRLPSPDQISTWHVAVSLILAALIVFTSVRLGLRLEAP